MADYLDSPHAVSNGSGPKISPPYTRYPSTFDTFQSQYTINNESETEESDSDVDGYSISKSISKTWANMGKKFSKKSQPKISSAHTLSVSDFENFKIRSLTIIPMDSDDDFGDTTAPDLLALDVIFDDQKALTDDEEDDPYATSTGTPLRPLFGDNMINMMMGDLGTLQFTKQQETELQNVIEHDENIIAQLEVFGYIRCDIIDAMNDAIDSNNINEIKETLDAQKKGSNTAKLELVNVSQPIIKSAPRTSTIKRQKKRPHIEAEIISTEKRYHDDLQTLLNELIQPMFDNGYVEQKYYDTIRSSLPKIEQYHKLFLDELNQVFLDKDSDKHKRQSLPSVFNQFFSEHKDTFVDIYGEFIKDYETILDLIGSTFHGNVELDAFLKEKRKERKPLTSFLILPIQRVPRYILLLTDLRKNTEETSDDYKDITEAVEMIRGITVSINEKKREIENLSTCLHIQEELNGLSQPIIDDHRYFIDQFIFIKKTINHQRLFFFFNDIVIVANSKWKVKYILDVLTLDVKIGKSTKEQLPEFELISSVAGNAVYIGQDKATVNKFQKLIGKHRLNTMRGRLTQRMASLGSLKDVLAQQAQMYDDDY
eukprot:456575_1